MRNQHKRPICPCGSLHKVRATNVSAVIEKKHLRGGSTDPRHRGPEPLHYDVIEFCQKPTCERVFKAELTKVAA